MALPEYSAFEEALLEAFPERFQGFTARREFGHTYAFPLIEAAVARSAERGLAGRTDDAATTESVDEFVRLINRDSDEAVAARVITDIIVEKPLEIGNVAIRPVGDWGLRDAFRDIGRLIPGTGQELDAQRGLFPETFHFSVLVARATAPLDAPVGSGYYRAAQAASGMISTALAAIRLATAATTQSIVEVISPPGYVRLRRAQIIRFDFDPIQLIQRMGRITPETALAIAVLAERLPTWSGDEQDPHTAGIALARYDRSYLDRPWYDTVVDMGVGLEAALLGGADSNQEISLRLRSRAAALLATATDERSAIYQDVKRLYNLRSGIVHGTSQTEKEIESELFRISSTLLSEGAGVKQRLALDRGRDLLRRAILARALLTQVGKWPPGKKGKNFDVDGKLLEPTAQEEWRQAWHSALADVGLGFAAEAATPAELFVALPDRVTRNAAVTSESGADVAVGPEEES